MFNSYIRIVCKNSLVENMLKVKAFKLSGGYNSGIDGIPKSVPFRQRLTIMPFPGGVSLTLNLKHVGYAVAFWKNNNNKRGG